MPARPRGPRPARPSVLDELGLAKSLPAGPGDFHTLCGSDTQAKGPEALFLGLGPEPERLSELFPEVRSARYIECPELAAQLGPAWQERIPAGYAGADPQGIAELVRSGARVILYAPGPRLFPNFWGPLLAQVQLALLPGALFPASGARQGLAWLPGGAGELLRIELSEALEALGYSVRCTGDAGLADFRALLAVGECPEPVEVLAQGVQAAEVDA